MTDEPVKAAIEHLHSHERVTVEQAVRDLGAVLPGMHGADFRTVVEALCSLFYVDTYERADLEPALEATVGILAHEGHRIVNLLLEFMEGSDIKSHIFLAQALGQIGAPALPALRRFIATAGDPYSRSFALFALGKLRDPTVHEALPEVLGSLMHPDKEVRDSAARVVGKIAEIVPADVTPAPRRQEIADALFRALDDYQPAVRAKVVRSLGKLAASGYLNDAQRDQLRTTLRRLLGEDEHYDWDRAYIVRREAEEALSRLS
jgi:HEAT repeat protein